MFQVLADAHIPYLDHYFPKKYFNLHLYHNVSELHAHIKNKDILICRSIYPINEAILHHSQIKLVATATSGINHLDIDYLTFQGISFVDAKGGNAAAVVDYVCASLASLEKNHRFKAQRIAILGYGHVGKALSARLTLLGYELGIYDPLLPKNIVLAQQRIECVDLDQFDTISIHANYHTKAPFPSKNLIDARLKQQFSSHSCIINAARGQIVDESFILSNAFHGIYCADVFEDEPQPSPAILKRASIATPHIAGHSIESKLRMSEIISYKIHQHFKLADLPKNLCHTAVAQIDTAAWQQTILAYYDPYQETLALRQEAGTNFFKLRHAHRRHEFSW